MKKSKRRCLPVFSIFQTLLSEIWACFNSNWVELIFNFEAPLSSECRNFSTLAACNIKFSCISKIIIIKKHHAKIRKRIKNKCPGRWRNLSTAISTAAAAASANPKDAKVKLMKNIYSRENLERLRSFFRWK